MMQIQAELLYLLGDGMHLVAAGLLAAVLPRERRSMTLSGVMLLPAGVVFAPSAQGGYWEPLRLFEAMVGIEDLLFCLTMGALAWGLAAVAAHPLPRLYVLSARFIGCCVAAASGGLALYFGLVAAGVPVGFVYLIVQGALAGLVLAIRPDLGRVAFRGAIALTLYYAVMLSLMTLMFGRPFTDLWPYDSILGLALFGLPLEEFLWATTFGAAWVPMLIWASPPAASTS